MTDYKITDKELDGIDYALVCGAIRLAYDKIVKTHKITDHFKDDGQYCWVTPDGIDIRLQTGDDMDYNGDWYMIACADDRNGNTVLETSNDVSNVSISIDALTPDGLLRDVRNKDNTARHNKALIDCILDTFDYLHELVKEERDDEQLIAIRYARKMSNKNRHHQG